MAPLFYFSFTRICLSEIDTTWFILATCEPHKELFKCREDFIIVEQFPGHGCIRHKRKFCLRDLIIVESLSDHDCIRHKGKFVRNKTLPWMEQVSSIETERTRKSIRDMRKCSSSGTWERLRRDSIKFGTLGIRNRSIKNRLSMRKVG